MSPRIGPRKWKAIGRLIQVVSCADRALSREVLQHCEDVEPPLDRASAREEGVDPSGDPLPDASRESLLLRIV